MYTSLRPLHLLLHLSPLAKQPRKNGGGHRLRANLRERSLSFRSIRQRKRRFANATAYVEGVLFREEGGGPKKSEDANELLNRSGDQARDLTLSDT